MKIISLISILVLACVSLAFPSDKKPLENHVSVLSVKREVFYFKVSREFLGATVVVLDSAGLIIHSEKVVKRKTIVDFFHHAAGTYNIKITKGELSEEFECTFNFR